MPCKAHVLELIGAIGSKPLPACVPTFEDAGAVASGVSWDTPANYVLAFDIDSMPDVGRIYVYLNRVDDNNTYNLWISDDDDWSFTLTRIDAGVQSGAIVQEQNIVLTAPLRIAIKVSGTTLRVYSDEVLVLSYDFLNDYRGHTGKILSVHEGGAVNGVVSDLKVWHVHCTAEEGL